MLVEGMMQKGKFARLRRSLVLTVGLSLLLSTSAMATEEATEETGATPSMNVSATYYHSVAYNEKGDVWYWGGLADEVDGEHKLRDNRPQLIEGLGDVAAIHSFQGNEVILKKDGTVWKWGTEYRLVNDYNHDGFTEFQEPEKVEGLPEIVKISVGSIVSALDIDGNVWVWNPFPVYNTTPRKITNITDAEEISMNGDGVLHILLEDGTVWRWETFVERQLNIDYAAEKVDGLQDIVSLSSGYSEHNFAVDTDGTVWGWGMNFRGALGFPVTTERIEVPTIIEGLSDVAFITTNYTTTLVGKNDGSLWIMGDDVGEGASSHTYGPDLRKVEGLEKVTSVAAGYKHAVAVTEDGEVWAWGSNSAGQLGDATFEDSQTPILVSLDTMH